MNATTFNFTGIMADLTFYLPVLLLSGLLAGFLAGLFGIGGGLVYVPVLFFLLIAKGMQDAAAMSLAVGTSLASILFTGTSSLISHHRLHNIDWAIVKRWSIPLVAGVLLSSNFVEPRFGKLLIIVFIMLLLLIAFNLFLDIGKRVSVKTGVSQYLYFPIAFTIGVISVLAGVGGGAMSVPALIIAGLSAHRAVGTSATLGLFIAVPAVIFLLISGKTPEQAPVASWGAINFAALLVLALTSVVSAPYGAKFGKRLPEEVLKKAFACCLLVVALSMYLRAF